jgi:RNA polymerase sigma-70 factor (ECF subfamily)
MSKVTSVAEARDEDADLVARLCAGEEAAFAGLVDAWSRGMVRLARSIVSTEASAAEVVQETWLAVVASVSGFEGRSSLRTWVYRILVNTAKRRAIQEQRAVPWASLSLADEPTVDPDAFQGADEPYPGHWRSFPEPWPEQATLSKEVLEVIRAAVDRLPAQQRAVITLRDIEGCSAAETCELLDLSEGNQRVLLHRARAGVRREVADYLGKDGPR